MADYEEEEQALVIDLYHLNVTEVHDTILALPRCGLLKVLKFRDNFFPE